jgi:hypothetical protein
MKCRILFIFAVLLSSLVCTSCSRALASEAKKTVKADKEIVQPKKDIVRAYLAQRIEIRQRLIPDIRQQLTPDKSEKVLQKSTTVEVVDIHGDTYIFRIKKNEKAQISTEYEIVQNKKVIRVVVYRVKSEAEKQ